MVMGEEELKYSRNFGNFREFGRETRDMTWGPSSRLEFSFSDAEGLDFRFQRGSGDA